MTPTFPSLARGRALVLGALVAVVVAACGSSTPSPSADVSAQPSAAAGSPSPTPDLHFAPALEARLPDAIGGVPMEKFSMSGADFMAVGSSTGQGDLQSMLQQLGKTAADLSVAETFDPTGSSSNQAAIFQVKGADPVKLLSLWVAAQSVATHDRTTVTNPLIDGHLLTRLEDRTNQPSRVSYAWSSGDSIVIVGTADEAIVREVLAKIRA
ncbi:MAG TPA: hypothetical protein VEY67_07020 [Candidatus Dormibacteraeota bacterium]|nr:hypothetical protein [Candidatus Dormibacteraeota bacterium]